MTITTREKKTKKDGNNNNALLWSPLLVPQMEGGLTPVWPVTAKVSVQIPVPEAIANPEKVSKSNLSWHTSSEAWQGGIIIYVFNSIHLSLCIFSSYLSFELYFRPNVRYNCYLWDGEGARPGGGRSIRARVPGEDLITLQRTSTPLDAQ